MGKNLLNFGDIVLVEIPFTDKDEIKLRPAMVLFEEFDNVVIIGITSNIKMDGIFIPKEEGLITDSLLKLNYIFTIDRKRIKSKITKLSEKLLKKICEKIITEKLESCIKNYAESMLTKITKSSKF